MNIGQPTTPKPKPPRVALWVTERELCMIAEKFQGFQGGLADAIRQAHMDAMKARTQHNRALRHYRNERKFAGDKPVDTEETNDSTT